MGGATLGPRFDKGSQKLNNLKNKHFYSIRNFHSGTRQPFPAPGPTRSKFAGVCSPQGGGGGGSTEQRDANSSTMNLEHLG